MDYPQIEELATMVRDAARRELLPRFAAVKSEVKADRSVVTVADRAMQGRLAAALHRRWPGYRLLGEETEAGDQARVLGEAQGSGLWVLDPLDGTSNFAAGIPCFSVSLALLRQGRCALGLVYDPLRDECFSAVRDDGAFLNGARLGPRDTAPSLDRAIAAVDFKRLPPDLAAHLAARPPYASQRSFGSVALDWCWVAAGRFHIYLHGKQFLWDYAAGHLILDEAGGRSSTLAGGEVFALSVDPSSAVAGLSPALFEQWFAWLQADGDPMA